MLAVVAVAVVWGCSFTLVDGAVDALPPADLVAWRFGLAALVLACFRRSAPPLPAGLRLRSVVLGALLGAGFLLQAWALTFTDALMSGFLTSLLVIVAPLAGRMIFGERLSRCAWTGVAVAAAGLAVLGLRGSGFGLGELLTLGSAGLWGLHVVLMSRWSQSEHAVATARIQTSTVAVLGLLAVVVTATAAGRAPVPVLPHTSDIWLGVGILAVVSTALAMVVLTWAQSRISGARTAVLLALEPAAAGITAVVLGADLTMRTAIGAGLLIVAMLVVESGGRRA